VGHFCSLRLLLGPNLRLLGSLFGDFWSSVELVEIDAPLKRKPVF